MNTLVLEDLDNPKVQTLMEARTLTVLERLDPSCKREVMSFLLEARLVARQKGESDSVISLAGADLNRTDLQEAVLRNADLTDVYLTRADLSGAEVTQDQLDEAAYLEGATMPNGQKYEDWIKDKEGQNISYSRSLPSRLRAALARVLPGVRVPPHRGRASAPDQAPRGSLTSEYTSSRHLGD